MKKTAHLLYLNYLSSDGEKYTVGGIQTYLNNLSELLRDMGFCIKIYQRSTIPFQKKLNDIEVIGVVGTSERGRKIGEELFKECKKAFNKDTDLLIFGSDVYICSTDGIPYIAIQHGITWDIPEEKNRVLGMLKKFYRSCLLVNRVDKASLLVCVDNNFINWFRATVTKPRVKMVNIPNFSAIAPKISKPDDGKIRIIFARRFFPYRGTRLFANTVKRLMREFDSLEITFAGEGPDEQWIKNQFPGNTQVKFITYSSNESLKVHEDKDIAVIPTLGSEGTSLSLLEAMSAQCAVVCTNVGGMTDIILPGFNGLIVNPDEESLYESLKSIIIDSTLRKRLSSNGYTVVKECFSKEKWKERWRDVIVKFCKDHIPFKE